MGYISPDFIKSKIANRVDSTQAVAQAEVESDFDNFATRYEPSVYNDLVKQGIETAKAKLLATSYGLFQIMGYNLKKMGIDVSLPGRAGQYLSSPTEQINSYVTYSLGLKKQFPSVNNFLAAYNGGSGSVAKLIPLGYYGNAEPYVFKVKSILKTVTPDDQIRYQRYQDATGFSPVPVIALLFAGGATWYYLRRKSA